MGKRFGIERTRARRPEICGTLRPGWWVDLGFHRAMRSDESEDCAPDWQIDLHGCSVEQALHKLKLAVQTCRYQRYRLLRVVTGRGRRSPGQESVLTPAALHWLESEQALALGVMTSRLASRGGAIEVELRSGGSDRKDSS